MKNTFGDKVPNAQKKLGDSTKVLLERFGHLKDVVPGVSAAFDLLAKGDVKGASDALQKLVIRATGATSGLKAVKDGLGELDQVFAAATTLDGIRELEFNLKNLKEQALANQGAFEEFGSSAEALEELEKRVPGVDALILKLQALREEMLRVKLEELEIKVAVADTALLGPKTAKAAQRLLNIRKQENDLAKENNKLDSLRISKTNAAGDAAKQAITDQIELQEKLIELKEREIEIAQDLERFGRRVQMELRASFENAFAGTLAKAFKGEINSVKHFFNELGASMLDAFSKNLADIISENLFRNIFEDTFMSEGLFLKNKIIEGMEEGAKAVIVASQEVGKQTAINQTSTNGTASTQVNPITPLAGGVQQVFVTNAPLLVAMAPAGPTPGATGSTPTTGMTTTAVAISKTTSSNKKTPEETTSENVAKASERQIQAANSMDIAGDKMQHASGTIALAAGVARMAGVSQEKAAAVMAAAAALQMATAIMDRISAALRAGGGVGGFLSALFMGAAKGGVFAPSYGGGGIAKEYTDGGLARGSKQGYPAILHGTEAVVPLPDGKRIPVEMMNNKSSEGGTNNVVVNVNMETGEANTERQDGDRVNQMGQLVAMAVQQELQRQKRPGGILSPYGAA